MCISKPVVSSSKAMTVVSAEQVKSQEQEQSQQQQQQRKNKRSRPAHACQALIVQHNYHDRRQEAVSSLSIQSFATAQQNLSTAPFPVKLHVMLDRVEQDGFADIISWQPHGRCFVIHKPNELTTKLLPAYMNLSKLASFQRQLNLYGFGRITQGLDKGGYYQEYFLQGLGPLTGEIHRIKVKGTGVRAKANPSQEPNFWHMPYVSSAVAPADNSSAQLMVRPEQTSSSFYGGGCEASIISHDETTSDTENEESDEHSSDSCCCDEQSSSSPQTTTQTTSMIMSPQDVILMEWGMPFHALDDLQLIGSTTSSSSTTTIVTPTKTTSQADNAKTEATPSLFEMNDQNYLDSILGNMMTSTSSMLLSDDNNDHDQIMIDQDPLDEMLEKIIL